MVCANFAHGARPRPPANMYQVTAGSPTSWNHGAKRSVDGQPILGNPVVERHVALVEHHVGTGQNEASNIKPEDGERVGDMRKGAPIRMTHTRGSVKQLVGFTRSDEELKEYEQEKLTANSRISLAAGVRGR